MKKNIDNSMWQLFTPYSATVLKKSGIDNRIIEVIENSLWLEDFESLLPNVCRDEINKIKVQSLKLLEEKSNNHSIERIIFEK